MNDSTETVKVIRPECPGGYCVINKADMKPEDVLYEEKKRAAVSREKQKRRRKWQPGK